MIHRARFNSIFLLITIVGWVIFLFTAGSGGAMGYMFLMILIWILVMLASVVKMAITGKPLFYNTRVTSTKDGGYTEH